MSPERRRRGSGSGRERPGAFALPPELAEFLKAQEQPFVCVTQGTDQGTALVIKAPAQEIESVRGPVPIQQRQELYQHPTAPVIRLVTTIYDQPERPLKLESFINVADEQQRADFAALAEQETLLLLFYDERLRHRLTKRVRTLDPERIRATLEQAERLRSVIPRERYNFDRAKAQVIRSTTL